MATTRPHYHVQVNTPGYTPLGEGYVTTSKKWASAVLAAEARRYRDDERDLPRSQRRTGSGSAKDGYIYFSRPNDSYDLGVAMSWNACYEQDCKIDE